MSKNAVASAHVNLRLPLDLWAEVEASAALKGKSRTEIIVGLIRVGLAAGIAADQGTGKASPIGSEKRSPPRPGARAIAPGASSGVAAVKGAAKAAGPIAPPEGVKMKPAPRRAGAV